MLGIILKRNTKGIEKSCILTLQRELMNKINSFNQTAWQAAKLD